MPQQIYNAVQVVPYIGTWIETIGEFKMMSTENVVPYIGTWIETRTLDSITKSR